MAATSPEDLSQRFDESEVRKGDRYWSVAPDGRAYALENYEALRRFFLAAAQSADAMILWLA